MSSFGKVFYLVMLIWDYKGFDYVWMVNLFVLSSNAEALSGADFPVLCSKEYLTSAM